MASSPPSPPDREAYRLLRAGRLAEALTLAEEAVVGKRVCIPAHGMLATILFHLDRIDDAEVVIRRSLELETGGADSYDGLAHVSMLLGEHERANALYRRTVELAPDDPRFWYNLASSERSFGRLVDAERACDRAIALDRAHYASYLLRSELRVQSCDANHVEELQLELARPRITDGARVLLGYALAKELDDLQDFDAAFRWFREAASTRRRHLAYDVAVDERKLQRIAECFAHHQTDPGGDHSDCSSRHIFIIGLPRSGTTLIERILTGLPGVRSNGETGNFARALIAASPQHGPPELQGTGDIFERAAAANPVAVAANYTKLANPRELSQRIVEKMPLNYLYLGAIRRALPRAKLVLVRRSPLDSCFAMYRTLFGEGYPFSYDFEDLARYHAAYERLIAHWRAVLGDALHEVVYEDMISEPLSVGAKLAHACNLPWTNTAIEVQNNASVSLTASAAQVRRPIYGSSSGRWRKYRSHLNPLIDGLRRNGVLLPNDA